MESGFPLQARRRSVPPRRHRRSRLEELFRRHDRRLRGRVRAALRAAGRPADPERVRRSSRTSTAACSTTTRAGCTQCQGRCETRLINYLLRMAERVTLDYLRSANAQRRRPDLWSSRGWHTPDALGLLISGRENPEEAP